MDTSGSDLRSNFLKISFCGQRHLLKAAGCLVQFLYPCLHLEIYTLTFLEQEIGVVLCQVQLLPVQNVLEGAEFSILALLFEGLRWRFLRRVLQLNARPTWR